jgi:hypothetical protein
MTPDPPNTPSTHPDDHPVIDLHHVYPEGLQDALAMGWQTYPGAEPRAAGSGWLVPVWRPVEA